MPDENAATNPQAPKDKEPRAKAWLSKGLETLWAQQADAAANAPPIDVLIIGSGYGGAVAAAELAGKKNKDGTLLRVCVLERGSEYLSGMFPARASDLAGHVRFSTPLAPFASGKRTGLFDVKVGPDVNALVASGLGGGSLINAGVMLQPHHKVFQEARWPHAIRKEALDERSWTKLFTDAQAMLGAQTVSQTRAPYKKMSVMKSLGEGASRVWPSNSSFSHTPITVAEADGRSTGGVAMSACIGCGDCFTGCNHGAKLSLDVSLLVKAKHNRAEIFTGATVLKLVQDKANERWQVHVVHTDPQLRRRESAPLILTANHVILSAGSFGSTEILMRSEVVDPKESKLFSSKLGAQFSTNGDMIEAGFGLNKSVNCVATESDDPKTRNVGPTITTMIDSRTGDPETDLVVQEMSVPGALRRLFEEGYTLAKVMNDLALPDKDAYGSTYAERDNCAVDRKLIDRTLVVALIGRDAANGTLRLTPGPEGIAGDGAVSVVWPEARNEPRLIAHHKKFAAWLAAAKFRGKALSNPMWRLLPEKMDKLLGGELGPLITVHPLGGCAMGEDVSSGVVDHFGRVFDGSLNGKSTELHKGLMVLDGSIVPTSLGINPALTITVLAHRAVQDLVSRLTLKADGLNQPPARSRPVFRRITPITDPQPTEVELIERTSGRVKLRNDDGAIKPYWVELTLAFESKRLDELIFEPLANEKPEQREGRRSLTLNPKRSTLRIFELPKAEPGRSVAVKPKLYLEAPLEGTLYLFRPAASSNLSRIASASVTWFLNRGLRDGTQGLLDHLSGRGSDAPFPKWKNIRNLSSRAGGIRLLEYELNIRNAVPLDGPFKRTGARFSGQKLTTVKRLTYGVPLSIRGLRTLIAREAPNAWLQMTQMEITAMPRARLLGTEPTLLTLELPYLAKAQVPLLHLVKQQDHPAALIDLASFALYFSRILIQIHAWSFRKPDPSPSRPAQRLPGVDRLPGIVDGLPPPEILDICTGVIPEDKLGFKKGSPVMMRLTRYRAGSYLKDPSKPPVMLIHGYSASGTSFAHHAIPCSLAQHLCDEGRDVWIVDLRSSAGMPAARYPWSFEQIGYGDIPVAVDYICTATGFKQIDIVAHCMGSAMLWMALLGSIDRDRKPYDTAHDLRELLPDRIRRLVMSQIGPAMVMAPSNIFRAYLMRYVQQFLPLADYSFETSDSGGLLNTLIDRLLATAPYPPGEFQIENPLVPFGKRTSWVGTRHRMDALYGGVFKLSNMPEKVLEHINDFFGPLNIQTVSQVIHFAANNCITDRTGFNPFLVPYQVGRAVLGENKFPMLSLHGSDNKLADIATLAHMHEVLPSPQFESRPIPGYGHQDCLLGAQAKQDVFVHISEFFDRQS
jgi:cholesterol oxidase